MLPTEPVPLFASYQGQLSHEECIKNRDRLLKQIDGLAVAAGLVVSGTDNAVYDGLRQRFLALKQLVPHPLSNKL